MPRIFVTSFAVAAIAVACSPLPQPAPEARAEPPPVAAAPAPIAAVPVVAPPVAIAVPVASAVAPVAPVVERLAVDGDLPISFVRSVDGAPPRVVFLPGLCSNGGAYLHGFAAAARAHGGVVALDGDRPCGGSADFHSITSDAAHEEPRIEKALRALGAEPDGARKIMLIGYSLGATLAENLVKRSPERYDRVLLIGSPRDPQPARLKSARAVATMSCSLDVPQRMRGAARALDSLGIPSRYFEMRGCTHGNLADGDVRFDDALGWLESEGGPVIAPSR